LKVKKQKERWQLAVNDHVKGAAQQLIEPERNELGFHRQIECHSMILPARLIRALGRFALQISRSEGDEARHS
jgi:hypothetical protein